MSEARFKIKKRFQRTAKRERQKEERKNRIEKVARIPHSTVVSAGKTKELEAQNIELVQRRDQIPSNRGPAASLMGTPSRSPDSTSSGLFGIIPSPPSTTGVDSKAQALGLPESPPVIISDASYSSLVSRYMNDLVPFPPLYGRILPIRAMDTHFNDPLEWDRRWLAHPESCLNNR
ncbi:hypothetical protein VNO77_23109 [Canavalia gladiata]|uniref:Uncharacterized protein n=1 Tax=Canavalia gladiata TaxID=3824 RepID=A0AAN9QBL6_CANGL